MLLFFISIFSFTVSDILPPEVVDEIKEGAAEIVVGSVEEVRVKRPAVFDLRVESLEKSDSELKVGDTIKVMFHKRPEDFPEIEDGYIPVYVNKGDRIKVWLNSDSEHRNYYRPVMEGHGVEHLSSDNLENGQGVNIKDLLNTFWTSFKLWWASVLGNISS